MNSSCPRCSGFLIHDTEIDYSENKHGTWAFTKCLMCGFCTDPVMEQNRALVKAGVRVCDRVRTKAATILEVEL